MKKWERIFLVVILCFLSLLTAADIVNDQKEGVRLEHLLLESLALLASVVGVLLLLYKFVQNKNENISLKVDLVQKEREIAGFKVEAEKFTKGLSHLIDQQFNSWGLTKAEKEVASLLIKGLSFKEMAEARGISERTARQQSLEVYRKSNLSGRAELAAFFIEDLFDTQS